MKVTAMKRIEDPQTEISAKTVTTGKDATQRGHWRGAAKPAAFKQKVIGAMSVAVRTDTEGDRARLVPAGPFDLAHAMAVAQAVGHAEARLEKCRTVEVDLTELDRMDGAGAVLLARCLDRLDASGRSTRVIEDRNPDAARLITLYRRSRTAGGLAAHPQAMSALTRLGVAVAELPGKVTDTLDFTGRCAAALPKAVARPRSVDWRSLPRLLQEIGADALLVTGAANLLVGVIIGILGVSQLGRFGAVTYVPELVVVAHFRELGPLVTAIVVAGRSGAGLASEIATMKVSEEIDALQAMGFDPISWLVVPRCLALVAMVPLLTWVGDLLALMGGLAATTVLTNMTTRAYVLATAHAVTAGNFFGGLTKTPFLALAIGLIACGQGLATRGGAAAVGARTTTAVVLAMFSVIVLNALFTFFFALMGI
jgi:phospholipid/cholesterol/gamma-HCH transport system permease protein